MTTPEDHVLYTGWIGLGSMGLAMAINLHKHLVLKGLPALQYWNRTISKGDPLKELGGEPSNSVVELVEECSAIFISVRALIVLSPTAFRANKNVGQRRCNPSIRC